MKPLRAKLESFKQPRTTHAPRGRLTPTKFGEKPNRFRQFSLLGLLRGLNRGPQAMFNAELLRLKREGTMDTGQSLLDQINGQISGIDQLLQQVMEQQGGPQL